MPLINAFLWITLLLVLLLGLQLVMSYQQAERSASRKMKTATARNCQPVQHYNTRHRLQTAGTAAMIAKPSGFMNTGCVTGDYPIETVSFYLPSGMSASASAGQQKKAAASDCQSCA